MLLQRRENSLCFSASESVTMCWKKHVAYLTWLTAAKRLDNARQNGLMISVTGIQTRAVICSKKTQDQVRWRKTTSMPRKPAGNEARDFRNNRSEIIASRMQKALTVSIDFLINHPLPRLLSTAPCKIIPTFSLSQRIKSIKRWRKMMTKITKRTKITNRTRKEMIEK